MEAPMARPMVSHLARPMEEGLKARQMARYLARPKGELEARQMARHLARPMKAPTDGSSDGKTLGSSERRTEGSSDGKALGSSDGKTLDSSEERTEGSLDGMTLGVFEPFFGCLVEGCFVEAKASPLTGLDTTLEKFTFEPFLADTWAEIVRRIAERKSFEIIISVLSQLMRML
eukprot:scaffold9357_cov267-Chaetoceros_neogracile.AAC.12